MTMDPGEWITVHCFSCDRDLVTVPTVVRAERVLWDHIDATGHDVIREPQETGGGGRA